jgi:5-amino-6-(D-ribitylamino)uracil---L-tyrosine 4-hydroxyphenyl transferase
MARSLDRIIPMQNSPPPSQMKNQAAKALNTRSILDAVLDGRELSSEEALHLLMLEKKEDLARLQEAADEIRKRQVGESVLYTTGCSLFITNLCEMAPVLYPYPKTPGQDHIYILGIDAIDAMLETALSRDIQQMYISSGGFWPALQIPGLEAPSLLKTYTRLFTYLYEKAPGIRLTGLSPDEIDFLCIVADRKERYILELLKDHGLRELGGNGAEILVDSVRQQISPRKATVKRWFDIAAIAHQLDIPTIGKLEASPLDTPRQRISHLDKLRTFTRKNTGALSRLVPQLWTRLPNTLNAKTPGLAYCQSVDRLKLTAVMRLYLGEHIPSQQVFWPLGQGEAESHIEESQEGLHWGANDFGNTDPMAYQVFLSGSRQHHPFSEAEFQELIRNAERHPKRMAH